MTVSSLKGHTIERPISSSTYPDHEVIACGQPVPFLTKVCVTIHFEGLDNFRIQNQPVFTSSAEVSVIVLNGGAMGVLSESGDLVSYIGDVALRALLEEIDISNNGAAVEPMAGGRIWKV